MARIYLILILLAAAGLTSTAQAQRTTSGTIQMGDLERTYRLYIPASYNTMDPVPVMFNLHGDNSDGILQELFSEMNMVADTAGFIVVYPDAFEGNWSSGFFGASYKWVDDVGFLSLLLDSLEANYQVDPTRVYATGFGQGAFMSFRLACDLDDRIAGIGAITGNMTVDMESYCTGSRPMPVVHLHGDLDTISAYIFAGELPVFSLDSVLNFWEECYHCYKEAPVSSLGGADVVPAWPLASLPESDQVDRGQPISQEDIHPSQVIWEFLKDFTHANPAMKADLALKNAPQIKIYPEPFTDFLNLEGIPLGAEVKVFDTEWRVIYEEVADGREQVWMTTGWESGIYWVRVNYARSSLIRRVKKNGF